MKLVKIFAVLGIIVLLSAWLIGRYLGPDDLSGCAELKPSADTNCGPADVIVAVSGAIPMHVLMKQSDCISLGGHQHLFFWCGCR